MFGKISRWTFPIAVIGLSAVGYCLFLSYFPEPMIKRTEEVVSAEHDCKIKGFSIFILREKTFFRRGAFNYYSGSHRITGNELSRIAPSGMKLGNFEHGEAQAAGYYGSPDALSCLQSRMASLGYDEAWLDETNEYSWLLLDKVK